MTVRVLLFARYAELAGASDLVVKLDPDGTLEDLWVEVRGRFPRLGEVTETPLMACDQAYARPTRTLAGGEEVAFFPPVSGG